MDRVDAIRLASRARARGLARSCASRVPAVYVVQRAVDDARLFVENAALSLRNDGRRSIWIARRVERRCRASCWTDVGSARTGTIDSDLDRRDDYGLSIAVVLRPLFAR